MKAGITQDRQTEIDAHDAAKEYAEVVLHRGYGGQKGFEWIGNTRYPVIVSKELEPELVDYVMPLVKVRQIDDETSLYALP
jgi:hypothetical protein